MHATTRVESTENRVDKELMEKGLAVRRAVLGDTYVNAAMGRTDAFNESLQ
jgi:hypothetical protein